MINLPINDPKSRLCSQSHIEFLGERPVGRRSDSLTSRVREALLSFSKKPPPSLSASKRSQSDSQPPKNRNKTIKAGNSTTDRHRGIHASVNNNSATKLTLRRPIRFSRRAGLK